MIHQFNSKDIEEETVSRLKENDRPQTKTRLYFCFPFPGGLPRLGVRGEYFSNRIFVVEEIWVSLIWWANTIAWFATFYLKLSRSHRLRLQCQTIVPACRHASRITIICFRTKNHNLSDTNSCQMIHYIPIDYYCYLISLMTYQETRVFQTKREQISSCWNVFTANKFVKTLLLIATLGI